MERRSPTSVTDNAATNFNFDGMGLRPQTAATSSTNIVFNEVRVELVPAGTPPSISTRRRINPSSSDRTATFTVIADGTPPFSYQWFYNDDTLIPNATNAFAHHCQRATLRHRRLLGRWFSNAFRSMPSASAHLTVTVATAPSIVTQPQSLTVLPGQNATFTVTAGGSAPLGYQWYFNTNTLLTNATSDTLTVTNVQPAERGHLLRAS